MQMTFRVHIELGNDAMQTPTDVANALRAIATKLEDATIRDQGWSIRDENGHTIGSYGFSS
jgi:hypothetical protein